MQIADFVTEVPTPDPSPLRTIPSSVRFAHIDDAGRRGGVETLVMDVGSTAHVVGHRDLARARLVGPICYQISTRHLHGGRALGAGYEDESDTSGDDLDDKFRRLSPWLERTLRHRYGSNSDVEDLVQESFIRLARYEPAHRSLHPRALLLRIAGNLARDGHRRLLARGGQRHVSIDAPGFEASRLATPADQDLQLAIKQAILKLPIPLRDVFVLARFTPMTHAQIGERLGISTKTVEWRMGKAMALCLAELRD